MLASDPIPLLSITEVAATLSVSEASARNWMKAGYLQFDPANGISHQSFDYFCTSVVGTEKLTKRANKSRVDNHDHQDLVVKTHTALGNGADLAGVIKDM